MIGSPAGQRSKQKLLLQINKLVDNRVFYDWSDFLFLCVSKIKLVQLKLFTTEFGKTSAQENTDPPIFYIPTLVLIRSDCPTILYPEQLTAYTNCDPYKCCNTIRPHISDTQVDASYGSDSTHRTHVTGIIACLAGGKILYKTNFQDTAGIRSIVLRGYDQLHYIIWKFKC